MKWKKGDPVEVSSDEEGFRGAWFPATIVSKLGAKFLVEFRDLVTEDEQSKLKEMVDARQIRPEPPLLAREHFVLHENVDAYDKDAWWAGVVMKVLADNKYIVGFSQTKEELEYAVSELRAQQYWISGKWVQASEIVVVGWYFQSSGDESDRGRVVRTHCGNFLNTDSCRQKQDESIGPLLHEVWGYGDEDVAANLTSDISVPCVLSQNEQTRQMHPKAMPSCHENIENNSSIPVRRSPRSIYKQSETNVCRILEEAKADSHCASLQIAGRQLTQKSAKKCRMKPYRGGNNMETTEIFTGVRSKKEGHSSASPLLSDGDEDVTTSEALHEVINPGAHDIGLKREPHKTRTKKVKRVKIIETENPIPVIPSDSPVAPEKTVTITIPYVEYIGQSVSYQGNTRALHGKATVGQLKLVAYHSVLQALYIQGVHNWKNEIVLTGLREVLHISNEEHSNELRHITSCQYD
eukprot:Gb_02291 [translate_table: standard]